MTFILSQVFDMPPQVDIDATKRSITAHKGHLTRTVTAANRAAQYLQANPSPQARAEADRVLVSLQTRYDTITGLYDTLITADGAHEVTYQAALDAIDNDLFGPAQGVLMMAFQAAPAAPLPAAAPPQQARGGTFKLQTGLKPSKLQKDADPVMVRAFIDEFKSFYNLSNMDVIAVADQQAIFYSCLTADLAVLVRDAPGLDRTSPVFSDQAGEVSCFSALNDRFQSLYPLFSRRVDFFHCAQQKGQKFSDWYAKLRPKGEEADLVNLDVDGQYVFHIIRNTCDQRLKEKFLKLKDPTLKDILDCAETYEVAARSLRDSGISVQPQAVYTAPVAIAAAVKFDKASKPRDRGRCYGCGAERHKDRRLCPAFDTTCSFCKRPNHLEAVCLSKIFPEKLREKDKVKAKQVTDDSASVNKVDVPSTACAGVNSCNQSTPKLPVFVRSEEGFCQFSFEATPDSGATRTIIAENVVLQNGLQEFMWHNSKTKLSAANGSPMKCVGSITLQVTNSFSQQTVFLDALVARDLRNDMLISWHDLIALGVLPESFPLPVDGLRVDVTPSGSVQVRVINEQPSDKFSEEVEAIKLKFSDVLGSSLEDACGQIKGPPMHIYLQGDIRPRRVYTARQVPVHFKDAADKLVKELLEAGVLLPVSEPTAWVSPGHFVPKPDGRVRLVTDYTALNRFVQRPIHPFPSAKDLMQRISADSKFFAKIDAIHGYFQIPLDEESSKLTTFLLPSGRYRYGAAPMGLSASSDEFCRRTDEAFEDLPWFLKIVDDGLIQAPSMEVLLDRIQTILQRCRAHGIRVSEKKFQFGESIKFAGHIVSSKGVAPDPDKLRGIQDFPMPTSTTQVRSFLGLVNQLGMFIPDLSQMSVRIRSLLKKGVAFVWTPDHQLEFEQMKSLLMSNLLVKPFDPSLPTTLLADASRLHGIGYALLQTNPDGTWRLINCNSASLNSAQRNYAMVELEALAIQWAIQKCHYYLFGMKHFNVVTDHKPLVSVFQQPLQELRNQRLARFREKLVDFNFSVSWSAGKDHMIADALSRAPVFGEVEEFGEPDVNEDICNKAASDPAFQFIYDAIEQDQTYQLLLRVLREGGNPRDHPVLTPFLSLWDYISIFDESLAVVNDDRVVVPGAARDNILRLLHIPHTGVNKTLANARQLFYWPGMANDVRQIVGSCTVCQQRLPSQPAEALQTVQATEPMQMVDMDLFDNCGADWIVMADRFSGYPFIRRLKGKTTDKIIAVLKEWFGEYGYPRRIRADNGPQFRDQFAVFCSQNNIELDNSSPYNHQSNGLAESAVKAMKNLIQKCADSQEELRIALLEWRSCPRSDGFSPARAFFGPRLRGVLPSLSSHFGSFHDTDFLSVRAENRRRTAERFRQLEYPRLVEGDHVLVQHPVSKAWDASGVVSEICNTGRSYLVNIGGKIYRRNRKFIRLKARGLGRVDVEQEKESDYDYEAVSNSPRRSLRLSSKKE